MTQDDKSGLSCHIFPCFCKHKIREQWSHGRSQSLWALCLLSRPTREAQMWWPCLLHSCRVTRKHCWPPEWGQGANSVLRQSFSHSATQERPGCKIHVQWPQCVLLTKQNQSCSTSTIAWGGFRQKGENCGEGVNGRTCYFIFTGGLDKRDSDDTADWAPIHTIKLWLLRRNATFLQVHGKKQLVNTFRRNIFRLLGQNCCPAIFSVSKECTQPLSHERLTSKNAPCRELKKSTLEIKIKCWDIHLLYTEI